MQVHVASHEGVRHLAAITLQLTPHMRSSQQSCSLVGIADGAGDDHSNS